MAAPVVRRHTLLLAALLGSCLLILSFQVRRTGSHTLAEEWLLDLAGLLSRPVLAAREAREALSRQMASRSTLLEENAALRVRASWMEAELLRLRDAERDRNRLVEIFGLVPDPPPGTRPARLIRIETAGPFQYRAPGPGPRGRARAGLGRRGAPGARRPGRRHGDPDRARPASRGPDRRRRRPFVRTARAAVARGDGSGGVSVQYVPTASDVVADDVLVTSGADGVTRGELPVGQIAAVRRPGNSLFLDLPIRLLADPRTESVVLCLPPVLPAEARGRARPAPNP